MGLPRGSFAAILAVKNELEPDMSVLPEGDSADSCVVCGGGKVLVPVVLAIDLNSI